MKTITPFFLTLLFAVMATAAPKASEKLAFEEEATLPAFQEFAESCKAGKLKSNKTNELAKQFAARFSEWDVAALLMMRTHCAKGKTAQFALDKLSQDAVMTHPKNLIQAMTEQKVSHDILIKIAGNSSKDAKKCNDECFEQRMEKISNLELSTEERETRDRFLSEMRVAFGKLKEKKLK